MRSILFSLLTLFLLVSCDSVDDERIPYAPVHLSFANEADWLTWGVPEVSAGWRRYIYRPGSRDNIPVGYPYKGVDATGYGGLLLVTDALGNPVAYDLACPYEARPEVRIEVPEGELFARCPKCGSTYDIFTNHGNPRSGPAADRHYGLRRYSVVSGGPLEYRAVTR
ncbi:MAG: hypothetical protein K2K72_01100 [Duncaniella sp.]|nr:hypothetical protein [Duncaniella sp.]